MKQNYLQTFSRQISFNARPVLQLLSERNCSIMKRKYCVWNRWGLRKQDECCEGPLRRIWFKVKVYFYCEYCSEEYEMMCQNKSSSIIINKIQCRPPACAANTFDLDCDDLLWSSVIVEAVSRESIQIQWLRIRASNLAQQQNQHLSINDHQQWATLAVHI